MSRPGAIGLSGLVLLGSCLIGCGNPTPPTPSGAESSPSIPAGPTPSFSLAWSEYPSWSVFGVADELGIVAGKAGELGEIEKKYGVDIVLREAGYDSCLNMFGSGECDAVCMTNMDALIICPSRDGVAVLPTSTSNGADACIVAEALKSPEDLKGKKVYGLKGTVSEYCFVRCLEKLGFQEADFEFVNQDPAAAALEMQQKSPSHEAIMVWNPFVLQTLSDRPDTHVLFDSSQIPGEIVDMVVVGRDILEKPKADDFIRAVIETYYRMNQELADPAKGDELLVALGKKFSNLGLEPMKQAVEQTRFYKTPAEAKALFGGQEFRGIMAGVAKFCVEHKLVENPTYGFDAEGDGVQVKFDASYLP